MSALRTLPLLAAAWLGAAAHSACGDDVSARYCEGLRQRGLFSLAEQYCVDRLGQPRLSAAARAEWTIELSRTYAEHGRQSSGDDQSAFWKQAEEVLLELLKREPENPRRLQLQAQSAFVLTSQAQFLAAQAETAPDDAAAAETALDVSQKAIDRLRVLEKAMSAPPARRPAGGESGDDGLPPATVKSLLETVRFTLATTLIDRARLKPRGSPDRMSAVIDAEEILRKQAGGVPGEILTWNARVGLAECARLKGETKHTSALLAALEKDTPPAEIVNQLLAVRARAAMDAGKPDDAAALISQHRRQTKSLTGELHYLKSSAVAAMADVAAQQKDAVLADELHKQLELQWETAEREVGGWWAYRCRLVLDSSNESREYGREIAPLVRKARGAWGAGKIDQAIDDYAAAAVKASRSGNETAAVEVGLSRGTLLMQADRFEQAAADFLAVAEKYPKNSKAPEAHLTGAYCLGRWYESNRTQERREAYAAALQSHREMFPDSPTAFEAVWMLAALQERRLQATQALRLYEEIPEDHARGPEAQVAVARCLETILNRLRETQQPPAEWESAARVRLDRVEKSFPAAPKPLSRTQAEVAVRYARICLGLQKPDSKRADALLERVLATPVPDIPSDIAPGDDEVARRKADALALRGLHRTATQLRIVSFAGQRQWLPAEQLIERISDANPAEVVSVLVGLSQAAAGMDAETRRGLGELQLKTSAKLSPERTGLNAAQQRQLDESIAQALLATNQPRRAAATYEAIVRKNPDDIALRRIYADILYQAGTKEHLTKAYAEWRRIELSSKEGDAAWLEARYQSALCAFALNDLPLCRKIVRTTSALYPELGNPALAARFRELERKVREE